MVGSVTGSTDKDDVDIGDRTLENEGFKLDSTTSEEDANDGSDTARVVNSATTFARKCLRTESYKEAAIALQSALELAHPSTTSYKMVVLHTAQLLQASNQLEACINCLLNLYLSMPPPLSSVEGICIIARLYEQLDSPRGACFWWNKSAVSAVSRSSSTPPKPDAQLWEAMGNRLFDFDLHVFAADFYGQALLVKPRMLFWPSIRFRYHYLSSLLEFVGPHGRTAHNNSLTLDAWSLAQRFRRKRGESTELAACYGDPSFYQLRVVYSNAFPAIYRVVFAWVDGPAGRIARWWRRRRAERDRPQSDVNEMSSISVTPEQSGYNNKSAKALKSSLRDRNRPRAVASGKVPASKPPSLVRKPFPNTRCESRSEDNPTENNCKTKERSEAIRKVNVKRQLKVSVNSSSKKISNNTPIADGTQSAQADRKHKGKTRFLAQKNDEFHGDSATKRKLRVVRNLRRTSERPSSPDAVGKNALEDENMQASSSTSLLNVYPLLLPNSEDFVANCGRQPGFADLDLDEVRQFARLAHYRARVLTGKHSHVESLDSVKVKPQWLLDLERVVALVTTQQQRNSMSGKMVIEEDSIAHLAEVHTRLVLQLTTLCRQYTRDFGETLFTNQLRKLTRRLVEWRFSRVSDLLASLYGVKSTAIDEEKQRNLEFYHVHRAEEVDAQ